LEKLGVTENDGRRAKKTSMPTLKGRGKKRSGWPSGDIKKMITREKCREDGETKAEE